MADEDSKALQPINKSPARTVGRKLSSASAKVAGSAAKLAKSTLDLTSKGATLVGDLNGDGKVDAEDARIAVEMARNAAVAVGEQAAELGRAATKSDLAKDAATGALVGAAIAVPVPLVGPAAGATVGAMLGVVHHVRKSSSGTVAKAAPPETRAPPADLHLELTRLAELRDSGLLSEAEFTVQKQKLLRRT